MILTIVHNPKTLAITSELYFVNILIYKIMLAHTLSIQWNRDTEDCNKMTYNRDHEELFENGVTITSKLINEISAR